MQFHSVFTIVCFPISIILLISLTTATPHKSSEELKPIDSLHQFGLYTQPVSANYQPLFTSLTCGRVRANSLPVGSPAKINNWAQPGVETALPECTIPLHTMQLSHFQDPDCDAMETLPVLTLYRGNTSTWYIAIRDTFFHLSYLPRKSCATVSLSQMVFQLGLKLHRTAGMQLRSHVAMFPLPMVLICIAVKCRPVPVMAQVYY